MCEDKDPCNDSDEIEHLVEKALKEIQHDDSEWVITRRLRRCASREVLNRMRSLLNSSIPNERSLGAEVLGQFGPITENDSGFPELQHVFKEEVLTLLMDALKREKDHTVLADIVMALSYIADPQIIEPLVPLAKHENEDVRFGVVMGLMHQESDLAAQTLLSLIRDEDADTRNWATFAVGTLREDEDSPEIRDALFAAIDNPHKDTRFEALAGLAVRRDERIIKRVLDEIEPEEVKLFDHVWDAFVGMLRDLKDRIDDKRLEKILSDYPGISEVDRPTCSNGCNKQTGSPK